MNFASPHLRLALPLMLGILLGGCSLFGSDEKDFYGHLTPVQDFELAQQDGLDLTFTVHGSWSNTCWQFSHFEVEKYGHAYDVELINGHPPAGVCGAALVIIEEDWSITVPEPGTYTFRFSRGAMAPLDTTIIVP